jgi:acetyltransferase-like isoleucine patch superfamily enzyme
MLETLLNKFASYNKTCSVTKMEDKCVTFIREEKYINYLQGVEEDIWVIAHPAWKKKLRQYQSDFCPTVNVYYTEWPEYEFTLYHNYLHKNYRPSPPYIGNSCMIHPTVILDVDGLKVVHGPEGMRLQFKHTGCVMIGENVSIGPYSVVHRGTMGLTSISAECQIGAFCNIGHNCRLGRNNVLAAGVIFSGGVCTGENCWFGSGSIVKHKITITDNVIIGTGAVVVKDITESGIYIGNPAKFLRPVEEGFNF